MCNFEKSTHGVGNRNWNKTEFDYNAESTSEWHDSDDKSSYDANAQKLKQLLDAKEEYFDDSVVRSLIFEFHEGVPSECRPKLWMAFLGVNKRQKKSKLQFFMDNMTLDEENQRVIKNDVERTRATLETFRNPQKRLQLEALLTFYCRSKSFKYKQGLNEVLAPFLFLESDTFSYVDAFNCFYAFVSRYLPTMFADDDFISLQCYFHLFKHLLLYHDPALHYFLYSHGVTPELYVTPWFLTIFASKTSLRYLLCFWDYYIAEGDPFFFFFVALAFLVLHRKILFVTEPSQLPETMSHIGFDSFSVLQEVWQMAKNFKDQTPSSLAHRMSSSQGPSNVAKAHLNELEKENSFFILPNEVIRHSYGLSGSLASTARGWKLLLLDLRTFWQFNAGRLPPAIHVNILSDWRREITDLLYHDSASTAISKVSDSSSDDGFEDILCIEKAHFSKKENAFEGCSSHNLQNTNSHSMNSNASSNAGKIGELTLLKNISKGLKSDDIDSNDAKIFSSSRADSSLAALGNCEKNENIFIDFSPKLSSLQDSKNMENMQNSETSNSMVASAISACSNRCNKIKLAYSKDSCKSCRKEKNTKANIALVSNSSSQYGRPAFPKEAEHTKRGPSSGTPAHHICLITSDGKTHVDANVVYQILTQKMNFRWVSIVKGGFKKCHDLALQSGLELIDHNPLMCHACSPDVQCSPLFNLFPTNEFTGISKDRSQIAPSSTLSGFVSAFRRIRNHTYFTPWPAISPKEDLSSNLNCLQESEETVELATTSTCAKVEEERNFSDAAKKNANANYKMQRREILCSDEKYSSLDFKLQNNPCIEQTQELSSDCLLSNDVSLMHDSDFMSSLPVSALYEFHDLDIEVKAFTCQCNYILQKAFCKFESQSSTVDEIGNHFKNYNVAENQKALCSDNFCDSKSDSDQPIHNYGFTRPDQPFCLILISQAQILIAPFPEAEKNFDKHSIGYSLRQILDIREPLVSGCENLLFYGVYQIKDILKITCTELDPHNLLFYFNSYQLKPSLSCTFDSTEKTQGFINSIKEKFRNVNVTL